MLRALVKGHAKTPLECLYLEAGAIPIRFILSSRCLIYHQNILKRDDSELIKRIYTEQRNNPTTGDFVELISEDFKVINEVQDDAKIQNTNIGVYKKHVKACIRRAAFKYLSNLQANHSKVKHIRYQKLEIQKYMVSPIFSNEEVQLLHALRSRSTDCKENFKQRYISSNLLCSLCQVENDDQKHILRCSALLKNFQSSNLSRENVEYENIFSEDVYKQKEIASLYLELFRIRNILQEDQHSQPAPSPIDVELMTSDNLLNCIVHSSSGK